MVEVKLAQALERCDTDAAETSTQFIKLCELQWTQVSATALRNLPERKRNGVKLLPLTEDVEKLNGHLDSEGSKHASVLEEHSDNTESYAALIQVVLAKVITFNRTRQGEVSKILLKDWDSKCKANPNTELETSLSEV